MSDEHNFKLMIFQQKKLAIPKEFQNFFLFLGAVFLKLVGNTGLVEEVSILIC